MKNYKPIPLESNFDWWWYRAKSNLLKNLIKGQKLNKSLKILEIGPGLGNNLKVLNNFGQVDLLEIDETFINYLIKNNNNLFKNFYRDISELQTEYDLVVMLDVLEHIENSKKFMQDIYNYIKPSGVIIIGVPAYKFLWSKHDENLKHYRRYNWKTLVSDLENYRIIERTGFNYLLLPLRYLQIKIQKNTSTLKSENFILNEIFYLISKVENFLRSFGLKPTFGISLYAVAKK